MFRYQINTQKNSKCRLCGDIDETVNRIIRECSKLALKEYKTFHNWVEKVIHWELCERLRFYHTDNWYIHKQESAQENKMYKILWNFELQTTHSVWARRLDLVVINE